MRGEELAQVRERIAIGEHLCVLGFTFSIVAHSISEEVAGFYPLWFPRGKLFVSLVSCDNYLPVPTSLGDSNNPSTPQLWGLLP